MAVLTAAAAMATVTIEIEKRSPIMTSLCVAAGYCNELFFEHLRRRGLNQLYRSSARGKMLDWCVCHPLTAIACPAGRHRRSANPVRQPLPAPMIRPVIKRGHGNM